MKPTSSVNSLFFQKEVFSQTEVKQDLSEDHVLWDQFRTGNESAFVRIYKEWYEELYNFGFQVCGDEDLVQDCIQDLFLLMRKNRSNLGKTNNIKLYLFKSLKRKIIREKSKWYNKFEAFSGEIYFGVAPSQEQVIIDHQIDEDNLNRLNQAIQNLSPRKREVLYYFYFLNFNYSQIKDLMHFSNIKSARNLLYESIESIRKDWK